MPSSTPDLVSSIGTVSTVITVIFAVLVIIGALKGLRRGFLRQTVRTLTIIASALLAFYIVSLSVSEITAECEGQTLGEVLAQHNFQISGIEQNTLNFINSCDAETAKMLIIVPLAAIALPIIFALLFMVISALMEIVHAIICLLLGFRKSKNTMATRLLGAILGAVQGVAVCVLIMFPIANVINIADTAAQNLSAEADDASEVTVLTPLKDNLAMKLSMSLGGSALSDKFAIIDIDGESYDTRDAMTLMTELLPDFSMLEDFTFEALTEDQKAALENIENKLFTDKYVATTASGVLRELYRAVDQGIIELETEDTYKEMIVSLLSVFESSNADNIEGDMQTIIDIYIILSDSGALASISEGSDALLNSLTAKDENGDTVIRQITGKLNDNPHMKPVLTMLTKLSVSVMAESLGLSEDVAEVYENVKEGIGGINNIDPTLGETEYKQEVADIINNTLADDSVNIELEPEIVDGMADYVYENYKDKELSEDEINDIILSYYDSYLQHTAP